MANEMGERMAKLEEKTDNLCKEFVDFKADYKLDMAEIKSALTCLDNKFAPKWVEWFVKGLIAAICFAGFIGLVFFLVQGHIKF